VKRACIIGNSHLACLKLGWENARSRHAGIDFSFFGSPGLGFQDMELAGAALVPTNSGLAADMQWTAGHKEIALDHYDAFVLVALQFAPTRVSQVARQFSYVDACLDPRKRLVSRACFEQAISDGLQSSIAISLSKTIRSASGRPVFLLPQPHVSAAWRETPAFRGGFHESPDGCWPLLASVWKDCASRIAREAGAVVLFQPQETIEDSFFTRDIYSRDSVMLAEGYSRRHPDDDFVHMNAAYGELLVEALIAAAFAGPQVTAVGAGAAMASGR